ncbi:MAG: hypothetical protein R6W91_03035, partial [Thermoplasmata archaeon]
MKYKILTAAISIVCILLMMTVTFQPVAANTAYDNMVIQPDITMDQNGNFHMVYSQLVRYYVSIGNAQVPKWQAEVFYKNNIGLNGHGDRWNAPIQISDSEADSSWPQVSVDSSTGIVYVSWTEEARNDNKFWYAGSSDNGISFTPQRYGAAAPWPVAPNQDMVSNEGILSFTWAPFKTLELTADIDGDMIPDISDAEPMIYNTDNFAIEIEPDVVATDNDFGVTVAIDYGGEDDTFPEVTSTTGDFAVSTGDYIEITLDTDADFSAIIKMQYSDVPEALTADYLRLYRQEGDGWVVVTDWELGEFTGINTEHGFVWAYVNHFSNFTIADASQIDEDGDGLVDLTEDTEPNLNVPISLTEEYFNVADIQLNSEGITYLSFEIDPYNSYLAVRGYLEITSISDQPIEGLELDIGDNGRIDWRAPADFEGTIRIGSIKNAISDYMFKNYLNSDATLAEIPFRFISSTPGEFYLSDVNLVIEDVTTYSKESDTSGDGLVDGWHDQNGNFVYEREGIDSKLGTENDEIPGALAHNIDPRQVNVIGSGGRVPWNEFQEGINQVNGNLALTSQDLDFQALRHNIMLERTYNSLSSRPVTFDNVWYFRGIPDEATVNGVTTYLMDTIWSDNLVDIQTGIAANIWCGIRVYKYDSFGASTELTSDISAVAGNPISGVSAKIMGTWTPPETTLNGGDSIVVQIWTKNTETGAYTLRGIFTTEQLSAGTLEANQWKITYCVRRGGFGVPTYLRWGTYVYNTRIEGVTLTETVGPFGHGWSFNYGERLRFMPHFTEFIAGDGSYYDFEDLEDGTYSSPPGSNIDMRFTGTGYTLRYTDGSVKYFDTAGRLLELQDKNGNALHMNYAGGKLVQVADDTGLHLNFTYTGDFITEISDPLGRTNTYAYQDGMLVSRTDAMGNTYHYEYDPTLGKISTVINPLSMYREYQYTSEFPHKATRCTVGEYDFDTAQKTPVFIEYDAVYTYPSHMSALDANGQNSTKIFDKHGVAIEVTNPDGNSTAREYDSNLNAVKETDALGNEWNNNYDPLGNQIEQKDPTGNASVTEFENVVTANEYISLPTKIVDKTGAETTYAYDENRNPVAMTDPGGNTAEFGFTADGLLQNQTQANGATTSYT